ncbi:MAG: hypothetical protein ACRDOO_06635 [Actinomadura sp.]
MSADPAESVQPDFSTIEGDWISVTGLSFGISRVHTRRAGEGLIVHAYGAGGPGPDDWGSVDANGIFIMRPSAGFVFTAEFENETMRRQLQSYRSAGLLSVTGFHRFTDDSGRRDFFTREHYVRADRLRSVRKPPTRAGDDLLATLLSSGHDSSGLVGTWLPANPPAKVIAQLDCAPADGGLMVSVQGTGTDGPSDWGTTVARLYADIADPRGLPAALATFDQGDRLVHLDFREHMGVLVVGEYTEFTDGSGRPDYFIREVYILA